MLCGGLSINLDEEFGVTVEGFDAVYHFGGDIHSV